MRSKTRIIQTPLRRSPRKFPASTYRALPVLLAQDDESHGKPDDPQKTVLETYSDSGENGDNVGTGVDVVEKERNLSPQVGNNGGDDTDTDTLGLGICIRCGVRDELVLVCGEIGCLIAVHEKCMGCDPLFDGSGKFRCPVCGQKRAAAQVEEARRKVMAAKRALSSFLEGGAVVGDKGDSENRIRAMCNAQSSCHDREKMVIENEVRLNSCGANGGGNVGSSGEGTGTEINSVKGSFDMETEVKACLPETRGLEAVEKEDFEPVDEDIAEDREVSKVLESNGGADKRVSEKDEGMEEVQLEASDENDISETVDENEISETEYQSEGEDKMGPEKNGSKEEGEEELQPEASDELGNAKDVSETETVEERQRPKRFKQMAGKTVNLQKKASTSNISSPQVKAGFSGRKAVAKKNASTFYEKVITRNKSKQSANSFAMENFPQEKRKRLHWTSVEEEILREGVREFTQATNKNISWKSILEFGGQVFHTTRTPSDLKDKWRTMMAKEDSRVKRR